MVISLFFWKALLLLMRDVMSTVCSQAAASDRLAPDLPTTPPLYPHRHLNFHLGVIVINTIIIKSTVIFILIMIPILITISQKLVTHRIFQTFVYCLFMIALKRTHWWKSYKRIQCRVGNLYWFSTTILLADLIFDIGTLLSGKLPA